MVVVCLFIVVKVFCVEVVDDGIVIVVEVFVVIVKNKKKEKLIEIC